tara:strand:- start:140 stop:1129 length:990 start_codon:yes stop_codon:yes gene_type:complete
MAFANPNVTDVMATTIQSRSRKIADNVTKNNAILSRLSQKGRIKPFSGGYSILQELSFTENPNGGWYSGYDILPVGIADVISAAEYNIKQCAVPVVISGLEMLQNSGKERMIDLMDGRLTVAESTMSNIISEGLYSNGTGSGFKQIDGLLAAVPAVATASQTSTYGGIVRSATVTGSFWRSQYATAASNATPSLLQPAWNNLWASCSRGSDRPDLIMVGGGMWASYMNSLQALQRFSTPETGNLGFPSLKFMDADVVLDGGIGGQNDTNTAIFLNTDYLFFRPHSGRNMVPLSPNKRYATNQDAEVQILAWAGNLASSGCQFQGRYVAT